MTVLIADAFTAPNGTAINGRTPDVTVLGRTWQTRGYLGAGVGTIDIQSNVASLNTSDNGFQIDCSNADFHATWYCTPPSLAFNFRGGIRFRLSTSNSTSYYFLVIRFDLATGNIRLIRTDNNVETDIGTNVTYSFTAGQTYKIELIASGNTYKIYVNDVLKKTETDSTYLTGTIHGFGSGAISSQNFTIDSVEVSTLGGVSIPVLVNHYKQQGVMA